MLACHVLCDKYGGHNADARLFQVVGPLTAKFRCRTVARMYTLWSQYSAIVAGRRCRLPQMVVVGIQVSRGNITDTPDQQGRLEYHSLQPL